MDCSVSFYGCDILKILELFSGTASFSKVARNRGYECFTVDNDWRFKPDLCIDIMELGKPFFANFDVIWASPPCQCFSIASIGKHWTGGKEAYQPKDDQAKRSIELIRHMIDLIVWYDPKVWIVENPRGVLRKLNLLDNNYLKTAWYCQYGDERAKPTDFWTNLDWVPKQCHNGAKDHVEARRGAKTGTQGRKGAVERSKVPVKLCEELLDLCEKKVLG